MSTFKTADGFFKFDVDRMEIDGERVIRVTIHYEHEPIVQMDLPPAAVTEIGNMLLASAKVD